MAAQPACVHSFVVSGMSAGPCAPATRVLDAAFGLLCRACLLVGLRLDLRRPLLRGWCALAVWLGCYDCVP